MNELALVIINEGADYQERLRTARCKPKLRVARWVRRVLDEATRQEREFGHEKFTAEEIIGAALDLDDYYRRHLAEF